MNTQEKIRELNVLNAIMLVSVVVGFVIGFLLDRLIGGVAIGMFVGFIGRMIYLRKKYKEIRDLNGEEDVHE